MKRVALMIGVVLMSGGSAVAFVNNQNAKYVLGQSNFTNNSPGGATNKTLNGPRAVDIDSTTQRVFVADSANNRVLIFNVSAIANYMSASNVLGQPNVTTNGSAGTATGMFLPTGVLYDSSVNRLFVSDRSNHRVLVFDNACSSCITNGMPANHVLGQPDFTTVVDAVGINTTSNLHAPMGMAYDTTLKRLFVADSIGARVLVFDLRFGITSNNMSASWVLGQNTLTAMTIATSQNGVSNPVSVNFDNVTSRLFVSDENNRRVVVYDLSTTLYSGMPATYVLGQSDFFSNNSATTQSGLAGGSSISFDPNSQQLFVTDYSNSRLMIFNLGNGITNGMSATNVLGAPNFTTQIFPAASGAANMAANQSAYDPAHSRLYVADFVNNRILVFEPLSSSNWANTQFCTGSPSTICGTVTTAENGTLLNGVPIELLDAQQNVVASAKTRADGTYSFTTGLTNDATYYVRPGVDRIESAIPAAYPVPSFTPAGAVADFQIRGVPATLVLDGNPMGTAIVISTANYQGANAPSFSAATAATSSAIISTAASWNGHTAVPVSPGRNYYVTCWVAQLSGANVSYVRSPSSGSKGPYPAISQQAVTATCN